MTFFTDIHISKKWRPRDLLCPDFCIFHLTSGTSGSVKVDHSNLPVGRMAGRIYYLRTLQHLEHCSQNFEIFGYISVNSIDLWSALFLDHGGEKNIMCVAFKAPSSSHLFFLLSICQSNLTILEYFHRNELIPWNWSFHVKK